MLGGVQRELARVGVRVGDEAACELLVRQHRLPAADVGEQLRDVGDAERADVDAVDRGHRCEIAGAEALEGAYVELRVLADGLADRLVQRVGAAQRAGDVGADVHAVASDGTRLEHVVEARDGLEVGGRDGHHAGDLLDRLGRAPAVHALCRRERGQRGGATVGVVGHVALDLLPQRLGNLDVGAVGHERGVLLEVHRPIPPGNARPVLETPHHAHLSMPPRIGSSIASVAIRSAM